MNDRDKSLELQHTGIGDIDRTTYLGSSDIAAVMGLGAYGRTAYTTYCAKIGESVTEMDASDRKFLERRKRWEGPIVEMLREEFGGEIAGINQRYRDPEHDFMAAEIDFEWSDEAGAIQNGEIKTVSPFAFGERFGWGEAGTADIPIHYAAQVMYGLMVTRRQRCVVAAMVGLDNMLFYHIERDEETIAAMRDAAVRFWNENVLPRVPPDPQTMRDMTLMMNRMRGQPVEIDGEIAHAVRRLATVRSRIATLKEHEEHLSFAIGDAIRKRWTLDGQVNEPDNNAVLTIGGQKVASWNKQRGAHLDQKRLKEEKPEIIKDYTRQTWFRVLRFHKPKGA